MQFRIYAWHVRHLDRKDRMLIGLLTITLIAGPACATETARATPTPTIAPGTAAASTAAPTPTRTTTLAPTTAPSSAAVVPTVTGSPRVTASTACPTLTGGSPLAAPRVASLRAAHNPGSDPLAIGGTHPPVPPSGPKISTRLLVPPRRPSARSDCHPFYPAR